MVVHGGGRAGQKGEAAQGNGTGAVASQRHRACCGTRTGTCTGRATRFGFGSHCSGTGSYAPQADASGGHARECQRQ